MRAIRYLAVAAVFAASTLVSSPAQANLPNCASLHAHPDDTVLGHTYVEDHIGFRADKDDPEPELWINESADVAGNPVRGLVVPDQGLFIKPPPNTIEADIDIANFSTETSYINLYDKNWNVLADAEVPPDQWLHHIELTSTTKIKAIEIWGGNYETLLKYICLIQ